MATDRFIQIGARVSPWSGVGRRALRRDVSIFGGGSLIKTLPWSRTVLADQVGGTLTTFIDTLDPAAPSRTTWIFGAGASAPYNVPTQANVLKHFATMDRPGGEGAQDRFEDLRERVRGHCKSVLPGLDLVDPMVGLEEVFSSFELTMQDPRSTPDEVVAAQRAFDDLLQALRLATQVFGRGDSLKWRPHERAGTGSPYAELIEKLFPVGASEAGKHSFVTFNYDVNLDRCLINLRGGPVKFDVDYGFAFANGRCPSALTFDAPDPGRSILLLRSHGALNWMRCRACRSVFSTLARQQSIQEPQECYACGKQRMDHVLVHPSYQRRYDDPILQLVWGRMYEELVRSERWVFVGYSLPAADFHFRELLRDALRVRRGNSHGTELVLVGRGPDSDPEFQRTLRAYESMFSEGLLVWRATSGGFSDFPAVLG